MQRFFLGLTAGIAAACFALLGAAPVFSQYQSEIGYNRLVQELNGRGIAIPTGAGIRVGMVEPPDGERFAPDISLPEFSGKFFTVFDSNSNPNVSGHATGSASFIFGNTTSIAPGATQMEVYSAPAFVLTRQGLGTAQPPQAVNVDVMNHSYVGDINPSGYDIGDIESNARMDFTVTRDRFTNVVALNNGTVALPPIYSQSYNSIVVGRTDGSHSYGQTSSSGQSPIGVAGRTKPDIVAPWGATSIATPIVSSTATLLHSAANALNRPSAREPEAMKAIIMAGADKSPFPNWSNSSAQPLDAVFGAGEVDVYNSYKILEGGEFNGSTSPVTASSGLYGWDLGNIQAGTNQYWTFDMGPGGSLYEASILLTWNARYENQFGEFDPASFSVANMRMRLFEASGDGLGALIDFSDSPVDNVEHLYLKNLTSGRYALEISSNASTQFGLAWRFTAVPEPGTMLLVSLVAVAGGCYRRWAR